MGITTTASSRTTEPSEKSTPEGRSDNQDRDRMDRALRELAYAPVIRTIDWPMVAFEDDLGGEGGES